jgi:VanZ family protein
MRSRARFVLWLILWIAGILFPMEFLARVWPAFGGICNTIFAPDWMHIIMHRLLYGALVFLLAQAIPPVSSKAMLALVGLDLLVGFLQEGLQLLSAGMWPGWPPEILDLSVDLIGASMGIGLSRLTLRIQRSAKD